MKSLNEKFEGVLFYHAIHNKPKIEKSVLTPEQIKQSQEEHERQIKIIQKNLDLDKDYFDAEVQEINRTT